MPAGLVAQAIDHLGQVWGAEPKPGRLHFQHHERAVFEISGPTGPAVVKVDTSVPRHLKESAVLAAARRAGLPVPQVLYADDTLPAILVLELLAGCPLNDVGAGGWRHAGEALRRLHDLRPPSAVGLIDSSGRSWAEHFVWWADRERDLLDSRGAFVSTVAGQMHRALVDAFAGMGQPQLKLLHGDCQPEHYLVDPRTEELTGLLDLGDAVRGDAVWDLAVLTLGNPERLTDVLEGYGPGQALRHRLTKLLAPYQLIRRLGEATWMREHGYEDMPELLAAEALLATIQPE